MKLGPFLKTRTQSNNLCSFVWVCLALLPLNARGQTSPTPPAADPVIPSLLPRDGAGHQFIVYADSCAGERSPGNAANFARVNAVLDRVRPLPEFICFPGDHILGEIKDYDAVRREWRDWLDNQMAWLNKTVPVYPTTSNHNTYDVPSEALFREIFPDLPQNGPAGQEGLAYFIRKDDLLMVFVNTSFSGLGGSTHVEHDWLDRVLSENQDARFKLVFGHYPILPVNGYEHTWIVVPAEGKPFWDVLVRHGVLAYICSHVIAYDARVQEGVLQILTGGAGTNAGPGGFMPGQTEYLHFVQMALDQQGLRCHVVDDNGKLREKLTWPLNLPPQNTWQPFLPMGIKALADVRDRQEKNPASVAEPLLLAWRFIGRCIVSPDNQEQTFVCGWESDPMEGPPTLWIGLDGLSLLTVRLIPVIGGGVQVWQGPLIKPGESFDFQLALHTGMGPGGVMCRAGGASPWSTLLSTSSRGVENLTWPAQWALGHGPASSADMKCLAADLVVSWQLLEVK